MTSKPPQVGDAAEDMLLRAKDHYRDTSLALKAANERLQALDTDEAKKIGDLLRIHWKALQTTIELEIEVEKRNRERAGTVHGYALDLTAARTEVGRRLACLKAASGD